MLLVFALSVSAFAADDDLLILDGEEFNAFGNLTAADYGVLTTDSVEYAVGIVATITQSVGGSFRHTFSLNQSSPSDSVSGRNIVTVDVSTCTVAIPAGTLTLSFGWKITGASTSSAGATVSYTSNSVTVVSDGSASPILLTLRGGSVDYASSVSVSSSFESADPVDPDPEPDNPYAGTGSMFGWTGKTIFGLQMNEMEHWYTDGSGYDRVGHLDATYNFADAVSVPGYFVEQNMLASLTIYKWQWKIDPESGQLKFNVNEEYQGTWSDLIYRTSAYNWYWGNKLWSNDVSGSWYGSISSDFSYLNYRVNQILQVLANDEDLKIKDATDSERQWVQDYFENGSDIADSGKYDKLNSTSSAFKDAFAGAPDSSIADGFTAVNDNGYDFWSASVSADINGESSVSTFAAVPYDQQVRDLYSENFEHIRGGTYD